MAITIYKQRFRLLQSDGTPYVLRREQITSMVFRYRTPNKTSTEQFTETFDYNLDEVQNYLWVNLPPETLEWYVIINVTPLRTIQTALHTTTFAVGIETIETFAVPAPVNSLQGFSPYVDPTDNYWYQYSDEEQTYVCTYIKAIDTTGSGHPIVDYIEEGVMSGVTSNAVAGLKAGYDNQISTINQNINNLQNHKVSAKLNGETHEEDDNGLIDLGTVNTDSWKDDLTMVTAYTATTTDGQVIRRGSVVDSDNNLFSMSDPRYHYVATNMNQEGWVVLCSLSQNNKLHIKCSVYSSAFEGDVYVERSGYTYKATTTSEDIAIRIKVYQVGYNAYLVAEGNEHVSLSIEVWADKELYWISEVRTVSEANIRPMDFFLTHVEETPEYENIDHTPYEKDELDVLNYNVSVTDCDFIVNEELDSPTTIKFVAMQDGTTVNVSDSTASWTATTSAMSQGTVAVLSYTTSDSYSWSYTTNKDWEEVSNKKSSLNSSTSASTTFYPSMKCLADEVGKRVSSVTLNSQTYTPVDGNIDLGDITGGTELDYDYTFTGYQGYDHTAGTPTENTLDFGISQPRNTMNFKIDSGVTWEYSSNLYPVLSVSSATYSNQTLVLTFDNESTGSTLYTTESQTSSQEVNPLSVTIYNYMTQTQQPLDNVLIVPANARVIYTLEYNSTGGYWSVTSTQQGSITVNAVQSVKVGNETYRPVDGVVTLPDYAKAVSGLSWNENNSTLTYKKINGEQDNITMNVTDQYAKRQISNVTLTVPSTEGVDKWVQICYIQHNTSLTSHTYADLHVEHIDADGLATGSDIKLRSTSTGSTLDAENQGDLSVWVSNQGCYIKVNTTAETNIDIYVDDANTTGGLMGVYTTGGTSLVATALAMGKHRDWDAYTTTTQPAKEVKAESGGSSMVFDTATGALTGAKDKSGNDVTLYFNSVTFTV